MAENAGARSGEEALKLRFEFFKHMTTVSTASTAAVVAVYGLSKKVLRDAAEALCWPDWVILSIPGFAIGGFFLSLLLSLLGLYFVAAARSTEEKAVAILRTLRWSAATFILGVGISAATAGLIVAGPKIALVLVVVFLALTGLILGTTVGIRQSIVARDRAEELAGAQPRSWWRRWLRG